MQPPAPPPAPAAPPPDAVASPVQNPLAAPRDGPEPVAYVSLVPGAAASRDGYFAVATAYSAPEDAKIRELSTLTLRLTIISLAVTLLFWLVVFAVNVAANPREAGWALFQLLVNGALYCYVDWVGVHGVRTKNAACCANADGGGCCCECKPAHGSKRSGASPPTVASRPHAIDATPARWRGDVGLSPLNRAPDSPVSSRAGTRPAI